MPYANPEDRRANWHKNRARNVQRQREYYQKHRAKRLAAKKASYHADPETTRARNRASYAEHKDKRIAGAKDYRRRNREELAERARERYQAGGAALKERRKELRMRPEAQRKAYAAMRQWLKANPDKALLQHAKRLLAEQADCKVRDIPNDVAEAKVEQLKITRWVREQLAAIATEAGTAETAKHGSVHEGAARRDRPTDTTALPKGQTG